MAQIALEGIRKTFGKTVALDDISMQVRDKEFFVLFGPAGAGKTTILKTVAGVEFPDAGLVRFDGEIMNLVDPSARNVSMVFENYALYPHMTVFDNIASPMRSPMYRRDEATIRTEVQRVADMMGIGHLLERLPSQLSNGQRQRTALGRCLVRSPKVFLMDEPLAHLDAKLRHLMRTELKAMQAQFETTTIYVTHDYKEALSLGDRIAIINCGKIVQVGSGDDIYYTPINEFAARLVGEPEINFFDGELQDGSDGLRVGLRGMGEVAWFEVPADAAAPLRTGLADERKVRVGVRGLDVSYRFEPGGGYIPGTVYNLETIGNKSLLTIKSEDSFIQSIAPNDLKAKLDSKVYFLPQAGNMLFFSADGSRFITRHDRDRLIGRG